MKQSKLPKGWDESKVSAVLSHYETQSDADAVSEDEDVLEDRTQILMEVPRDLVAVVRELIARRETRQLRHV
jgi:hypothetical protein